MDTQPQPFPIVPDGQGITRDALIAHANELLLENDADGIFIIKPAGQWIQEARNRPQQQMLFSSFWFDGEICILFADTNLGKSILAVQIGDAVSRGIPVPCTTLQAPAQPVLYFDFELTDRQFEKRYSVGGSNAYPFDANFLRIEINPDAMPPDGMGFEEYLVSCLERAVISRKAKILIIDNLTYLRNETEKAKDALPLMKQLKVLKTKHQLSILVLAHTPKRDLSKPITRNDLSGSKMLINFCDSAFAIGESSKDPALRYLKQIKQRNTEQEFGAGNVIVCQVTKPDNFLQFEIMAYATEQAHLREVTEKDSTELVQSIIDLKENGATLREIGLQLGISHTMVARHLNNL